MKNQRVVVAIDMPRSLTYNGIDPAEYTNGTGPCPIRERSSPDLIQNLTQLVPAEFCQLRRLSRQHLLVQRTALGRENLSITSPKTVKSGYNPLCDRTLTGTGSTAQETLENITLNSRSDSVSTAKSSCSSCHGRLNSRSAGTDKRRTVPSYGSPQIEYQALSERGPSISDEWPLQKKTQQPWVLAQEGEKHNVPSDIQVVFRSSFDSV